MAPLRGRLRVRVGRGETYFACRSVCVPGGGELAKYTLVPARLLPDAKLDALLGLHFRNVLGDALRAERGLARRLPHVSAKVLATSCSSRPGSPTARSSRSCRRMQGWVEAMTSLGRLIFLDQPGTGASDPVDPGRDADLGAMGRQHHRGARRSRHWRSGPRRHQRHARDGGAVRRDTSVPHHRAGRARRLRGSVRSTPDGSRGKRAAMAAMWGTGEYAPRDQSGHAVERGDPGSVGS